METSTKTTWQKVSKWLIIFSALPAFLIIMGILQVIIFGIWAVVHGTTNATEIQEAISNNPWAEILSTLTMTLSVLIIVWIYWMKIQKNSFQSIGFKPLYILKETAMGVIVGIFLISVIFLLLLFTGNIEVSQINFYPTSFFKYLIIFLLVGFHEELLTRGYFLGSIMKLTNKYVALLIVAILFSLMHILNAGFTFIPFLNIVLAGLILGVVYIHTKRLWSAISLHITWNFLQGPVFGSKVSGNDAGQTIIQFTSSDNTLLTGGDFGFEGSVIMTGLLILLIIILEIYCKKKMEPEVSFSEEFISKR